MIDPRHATWHWFEIWSFSLFLVQYKIEVCATFRMNRVLRQIFPRSSDASNQFKRSNPGMQETRR